MDNMMERLADFAQRGLEHAKELEEEIRQHHMSPPGSLNLPEPLEKARWKHAIPDEMLQLQAAFSSVLIKQTAPLWMTEDMFGDGKVVMPASSFEAQRSDTPRGVLVSAGLTALDKLRSHGMELGDVVFFVKHGPPIVRLARIANHDIYLFSLHVAEIRASEEAAQRLRSGEMSVVVHRTEDNGVVREEHVYEQNGERRAPQDPSEQQDIYE
jgi:hypothetical protein